MHIRISTDLEAPWDDSDDSFFTPPRDDDSASISSTSSFLSSNNPPQPVQQIQNPYHHERQPPRPNIIQTLRSWLQPQPTPAHPTPPHPLLTPQVMEVNPLVSPQMHQTTLRRTHHNKHWGDIMLLPKPRNLFRVISRNVNTLSTQLDYVQWKAAAHAIHEIGADAVSLQETNIAWNKIHQCRIRQIFHNTTGQALIATTISSEITDKSHQ